MRDDRFEVLPSGEITDDIFIIVLFSAKSDGLNNDLVRRINETREIYVSGTSWHGRPAARIAVSNWQVEVSRDFNRVRGVLESIASV